MSSRYRVFNPWTVRLVATAWLCGAAGLCAAPADPVSTDEPAETGINQRFRDPNMDVEEWIARFEGESREIFVARAAIVAALRLQAGERVADIGAGTGLFTFAFADRVGPRGWVFAVEIAPAFVQHIGRLASQRGVDNVTPLLSADDSTRLPPASIDVAFICDTYHHFEEPKPMLRSILQALRPGGRLIVIDFERIPGQSREWVLNHVRVGQDEVRAEIVAGGFQFVATRTVAGISENYFAEFRKPTSGNARQPGKSCGE